VTTKPRHERWMDTISEAAFQRSVEDFAALMGWVFRYHVYDARRSNPGFPDLVLVRPPRVIFAELKDAKGRVRKAKVGQPPQQAEWLEALLQCPGVETYLWRPSDWNQIVEVLKREGFECL